MGWFDARAHSVTRILSMRIRTYGINDITPINRGFNWKLVLERQASQMTNSDIINGKILKNGSNNIYITVNTRE